MIPYHDTLDRGDRNHYYFRPDGTLHHATLYDEGIGGVVTRAKKVRLPPSVDELSQQVRAFLNRHRHGKR